MRQKPDTTDGNYDADLASFLGIFSFTGVTLESVLGGDGPLDQANVASSNNLDFFQLWSV